MNLTIDRHQHLAALITDAAAGNERAFTELHGLTRDYLYHVALRLLRTPCLAEEALQEAFLNIWMHARSFRPGEGSPMTWLIAIVRNRALSVLRAVRKNEIAWTAQEEAAHADLAAEDTLDEAGSQDPILRLRLREAIDKVEPAHRQSLVLAYAQDMTHIEIARHMEVPLGTLKSWIRRGLARLRQHLEHPVDPRPLNEIKACSLL